MSKPPSRWCAETEIQVQFFDLDPMEVVWHGHYVKYLEIVRCVLLDTIDYNYAQMKASGYALAGDRYASALCRLGELSASGSSCAPRSSSGRTV